MGEESKYYTVNESNFEITVEGSLFHLCVCQNVVSTWDASGL